MSNAPSNVPTEAPHAHYETISGRTVKNTEKIDSNEKRIHFVDCIFEQRSEIPNNAQISGKNTVFQGKCKFGDGIKIMID
jgi:hypothetical protein